MVVFSPALVSVVIVSWNAKDYLAECLTSLQCGSYAGPIEVFVVDNGSTDGSVEMVRDEFPKVRLICNDQNLGFAKANNIGIRKTSGDYIALINSDVHVIPGCITNLVTYCQTHPNAGLVGPYIKGANGEHQRSCRAAPTLWNMFCRAIAIDALFPSVVWLNGYYLGQLDNKVAAAVDIITGCFWVAPRRAVDEVGLLDESFFIYGEDMDWCRRFRSAGWEVVFVPEGSAIHYGGASSANSPVRFFVEKQKADLQYWQKHHSVAAVRAYLSVSLLYHSLRILGYGIKSLHQPAINGVYRYKMRRSLACVRWLIFRRDSREPEQASTCTVERGGPAS